MRRSHATRPLHLAFSALEEEKADKHKEIAAIDRLLATPMFRTLARNIKRLKAERERLAHKPKRRLPAQDGKPVAAIAKTKAKRHTPLATFRPLRSRKSRVAH